MKLTRKPLQLNLPENFDSNLAAKIDGKTKPLGALGHVEALAGQCARVQGTLNPILDSCSLHIFAADHGIANAGVSAYPQEVTRQMVLNFLNQGAAANVFAGSIGASVHVVDAGVAGDPIVHSDLIDRRVGSGTANSIEQPAMTQYQLEQAFNAGYQLGAQTSSDVTCFGEMGIGNTSAASLVSAKLLGVSVDNLVGRGTGLNDEGLSRKSELLQKAASRTSTQLTGEDALREYGGFDLVMLAGAMIGAAEKRKIVIVDGYIATASALCASVLAPGCDACFVFAHQSAEQGHKRLLNALNARPLLDFGMRLGEGTGALLAFPIVRASAAMLTEMASFESASVSGPA